MDPEIAEAYRKHVEASERQKRRAQLAKLLKDESFALPKAQIVSSEGDIL